MLVELQHLIEPAGRDQHARARSSRDRLVGDRDAGRRRRRTRPGGGRVDRLGGVDACVGTGGGCATSGTDRVDRGALGVGGADDLGDLGGRARAHAPRHGIDLFEVLGADGGTQVGFEGHW